MTCQPYRLEWQQRHWPHRTLTERTRRQTHPFLRSMMQCCMDSERIASKLKRCVLHVHVLACRFYSGLLRRKPCLGSPDLGSTVATLPGNKAYSLQCTCCITHIRSASCSVLFVQVDTYILFGLKWKIPFWFLNKRYLSLVIQTLL